MKQTIKAKCPYCQHEFDYDGSIFRCVNAQCGSDFPQKQLRLWSRQLGELLKKTAPVILPPVGRDDPSAPPPVGSDALVTPTPTVTPPPERLFEFRGNVFYVGQEREICAVILQRKGLDSAIVDANGNFTPLAEKLCDGIGVALPTVYTENRLQKYFSFMYEVVFARKRLPLFVDGVKYADSPAELWRKIREGRMDAALLQQWEENGVLKCYLQLDEPYYQSIENKLNGGAELFFVSNQYEIDRLGTVAKLCAVDALVDKRFLAVSKLAHCYPAADGFDTDREVLDSAFVAQYGSLFVGADKASTIARYFYLVSVAMQLTGHVDIFGMAFGRGKIAKKAADIINWAVENNDIKRFLLLRQLLHFNVFGEYIDGLEEEFVSACVQHPIENALRDAYYLLPGGGKLLYFNGQYAKASQIALKLCTFETVDGFIEKDGSLIKAIENVYGVSCDTDGVKKKLLDALEKIR